MKIIFTGNTVLFILNLALYVTGLTPYLALLFQIVLGYVQLTLFLYFLIRIKQFRQADQRLIISYGILLLLYAIAFLLLNEYDRLFFISVFFVLFIEDTFIRVFVMVIPMLLAGFHLYITYRLRN